ncbi:MAG: 50S ribosomal protein L14e [Candidatus Micrarchaeota archaeon]|nr:50S ribosomal protein L14e [Candidatus Micrarchaeota archaeon]
MVYVFDKGRVCIKTKGRDAGDLCVVVERVDDNVVKIVSKSRKKLRKCSIRHLVPTQRLIQISDTDPIKIAQLL